MRKVNFEWDEKKNEANIQKHGISFFQAQQAFFDPCRVLAEDIEHSKNEKRYFCFGMVHDGIMTVRFTYRGEVIRIIGAGYWRAGKKIYEKEQS